MTSSEVESGIAVAVALAVGFVALVRVLLGRGHD